VRGVQIGCVHTKSGPVSGTWGTAGDPRVRESVNAGEARIIIIIIVFIQKQGEQTTRKAR